MIRELRPHQAEARILAEQIRDKGASWPHKLSSAYVTPGGGKTLLGSVFGHILVRGDVLDYVLYVCPRDTLRVQVAKGFTNIAMGLDGGMKTLSGAPTGQSTLLNGEKMGFVTTYQSIAKHPAAFQRLMKRGRWLLILDEGHHLPAPGQAFDDEESLTEAGWTQHIRPLVELAAHVLSMTGSPSREKGRIAFLRHNDKRAIYDITHTRRDALACKSVLHVITKLCDGKSSYWYRLKAHASELSADNGKESGHVLETALRDPVYRDKMLSDAIGDWEIHRQSHNGRSRMIVICDSIMTCRSVMQYIKDKHSRWVPVLAVSKTIGKEQSGKTALNDFREGKSGHILVTCQMAYEGLDVPDCTHLVCLTKIRSRSWLEQAFARVTRFDPECGLSWEEQHAYIYAPADRDMVEFLSEWLD